MIRSSLLRRRAALLLLLAITALVAGCGKKSGSARLPVYGTAMPASGGKINGSVTFVPVAGNSAPAATASLNDGTYRFDADNGPLAGRYEVIVKRAVRKDEILASRSPRTGPQAKAKPKDEWKLKAEVPAQGPHQIDFKLE